jgi:predicted nucleotidyltransferase component of viral defense system
MELAKLAEIRRLGIIAMFSDDDLMEMLVLKGGNAIALFYSEYSRASVDLDFSLCDDIDKGHFNIIDAKIRKVLERTFQEHGYLVFDFKFYAKPKVRKQGFKDFWGGYRVEFKLMETDRLKEFGGNIERMRKEAVILGSGEKKPFTIDISKHEFCDTKADIELDGYTIYVYTPEMMVIEKYRAICQQMPEYPYGTKSARARDFFDIFILMEIRNIDLLKRENMELFKAIFRAKEVPLELIGKISESREFHRLDFRSVVATVHTGFPLQTFDYYFEYVIGKTEGLEVLWKE